MTALGNVSLHTLFDWFSGLVLVSSLLGSFLPPYEWFAPWPRFQVVYRIITMTIARWGALNVKSLIYPSIASTGSPTNPAAGGGDAVKPVETPVK